MHCDFWSVFGEKITSYKVENMVFLYTFYMQITKKVTLYPSFELISTLGIQKLLVLCIIYLEKKIVLQYKGCTNTGWAAHEKHLYCQVFVTEILSTNFLPARRLGPRTRYMSKCINIH